jgi:hypothetical protein
MAAYRNGLRPIWINFQAFANTSFKLQIFIKACATQSLKD